MRPPRYTALAVAVVCSQCTPETKSNTEAPKTRVEVEPVRLSSIVDRLTLNAEVRPIAHTRIASGSGGKIDGILVDEGDAVAAGQLLAKVAAGLAAANLKQATATLETARGTHSRVVSLNGRGLSSPSTLEKAASALAQAEAGLAMARVRYDDAMVRAPHAGQIARRFASAGEHAAPGAPLFELVDVTRVKIVAQLPERDAPKVDIGREASITLDAWPDQTFGGRVSRIGVVAAEYSRTFDLEVVVPNSDAKLRPGMLARLQIVREHLNGVAAIRRDAIFEDYGTRAVYVERAGKAARVPVTLGPVDGERVAGVEGLMPGDRVVVVGQRALVHGQPVKVVREHVSAVAEPVAEPVAETVAETMAAPVTGNVAAEVAPQ